MFSWPTASAPRCRGTIPSEGSALRPSRPRVRSRGTQSRRPAAAVLARAAPHEPARPRHRGGRHAAPRELRRERAREPEPRDGPDAGPRARRAAARAQPGAARRGLRAAVPRDRARRRGDGAGPRRAGTGARAPRALPRGRDGPPLEPAARQPRRRRPVRVAARRRARRRPAERRPADVHPAAPARRQLGADRRGARPARAPGGGRRRTGPRDRGAAGRGAGAAGHPGSVADAGLRDHPAAGAAGRVRQGRARTQPTSRSSRPSARPRT